jgi:hypothetical protein
MANLDNKNFIYQLYNIIGRRLIKDSCNATQNNLTIQIKYLKTNDISLI